MLRPYQALAIEQIRARVRSGKRRLVVVAPTGAGKTILAVHLIERILANGKKVLFLAHRIELIDQLSIKLDAINIDHGIIQGDHPRLRPWLPIQIASVPTLARRQSLPDAAVVFVDECHHTTSASFSGVLARYPAETIVLGLTATPYRADGHGLDGHYEDLVVVAQTQDLINDGFLVPPRIFAPSEPNLAGVRVTAGEFNARDLFAAVDRPQLVGNVVDTWLSRGENRITVCFAVNIQHSKDLIARFRAAGVPAEHFDAETPEDDRRAVLARIASGQTRVLSNVGLVTEGWDLPQLSCVIKARPTLSRSLDRQMTGRGLRSFPGKQDCLVFDHAGNVFRHGLPTDPETYTLSGSEKRPKPSQKLTSIKTCKKCFAVCPAALEACPVCGTVFPKRFRLIREQSGELSEQRTMTARAPQIDDSRRVKALAKWIREGLHRGYSPARAGLIYTKVFGQRPNEFIYHQADLLARDRADIEHAEVRT